MRRSQLFTAGCLVSPPLFCACSEPVNCLQNIVPAVEVEVRDRISQTYLTVSPRGVVREGGFQDSLRVASTTSDDPPRVITMTGADERRGVYAVHLEAAGYQPWDTTGVSVSRDECHVNTESFVAELQPT